MQYPTLLQSSVDPNKLSKTIKGILTAIVPILIMFTGVEESVLTGVIEQLADLAALIVGAWGIVMALQGAYRKWKNRPA